MGAITKFAAKLVKILDVMPEEMLERIELEGKTYCFKEGDFYDFIVHSKAATLIYKHLDSQPHWEDYEFDKKAQICKIIIAIGRKLVFQFFATRVEKN